MGWRTREVLNRILNGRLGSSTSKTAPDENQVPGEQTFTDELNKAVIDGLNTAIDSLNMALEEFGNQYRNSPLNSPLVQALAPIPKIRPFTGILAKGGKLKVGKQVVSTLDKLKDKLTEARTFIRNASKQGSKLTPTQQATIAPYVAKYGNRVLEYAEKHGNVGVSLLERAGKQIGVRAERFINEKEWVFHFNKHKADTGLPWLGREFTSKEEYLAEAKKVISDPNSKKVLYYHGENLNQPRLGYLLEKNGKVFLVSVGEDGTIRTFHHLKNGWNSLRIDRTETAGKVTFDKLFEVDEIVR
ncbi:MAG: hypothetical protein HYW00_00875 [Candidatus Colwellbacteria bacterium]|nr:hypothetical protein [Candidatus Colwellbacteria bacterium]